MSGNNHAKPLTLADDELREDGDVRYLPCAPSSLDDTGVSTNVLRDLVMRLAYTVSSLTTEKAAELTGLPEALTANLLEELTGDRLLEILGASGPLTYRFGITRIGREHARRLLEICGYVGPAPVSLEAYSEALEAQFSKLPEVTCEKVAASISEMVLPDGAVDVVGLATLSGRTLLLYGPPGNGKSSIGRLLHTALEGELWIPYCIGIDHNIIRVFDPQVHEPVPHALPSKRDRRWVCVRRPFVIVGGELTMEAMELVHHPALRFYEAPMHMKANGGTFLLDDFGCQRAEPGQLLSRWVYPLERQEDHLTFQTGQKIKVPFRQALIVSTNLDPLKVMDPAFLRRMGYRLYLGPPSREDYAKIFERFASQCGVTVAPGLIDRLLERYKQQGRCLRGSEPRDLIERARDVCLYQRRPFELNEEVLNLAWIAYFGDELRGNGSAEP